MFMSRTGRRLRAARVAVAGASVALVLTACDGATSGQGQMQHSGPPTVSASGRATTSISPPPQTGPAPTSPLPTHSQPGSVGPVVCQYVRFGRSARPVGLPPARPVAATRLVLRLRLGRSPVVHRVVIALAAHNAPCAVNSVEHLARAGFYNATICPRLVTKRIYILQCGDPSGTGSGGPGYRFADELTGKEQYPVGTVAMADGTPDTNGSQFFIVYRHARIAPSFTVIGRVTSGLGVIRADARHGATSVYHAGDGRPHLPVHVRTAYAA